MEDKQKEIIDNLREALRLKDIALKLKNEVIEDYKLRMSDQNEKAQTIISELNLVIDKLEKTTVVSLCDSCTTDKKNCFLAQDFGIVSACVKYEEKYIDRLAELEEQILKYYLSKGFKLKKDQKEDDTSWFFEVKIKSKHKNKELDIIFYVWSDEGYLSGWEASNRDSFTANTTKEMFDKAFEFFKVENT